MTMHTAIALIVPSAMPARADVIRCGPERLCARNSRELPTSGPQLDSYGKTIASAKTRETFDTSTSQGTNFAGEIETVTLYRDRMTFSHVIGGEYVRFIGQDVRSMATGLCEVE
jgi:hypothetical protein